MAAYTYIVRCENGALYTGIARDIRARLETHLSRSGACAKFTRSFPVTELAALWECESYSLAARLEYAIKRLPKARKEELIENVDCAPESYLPSLPSEGISRVRSLDNYMDIFDK